MLLRTLAVLLISLISNGQALDCPPDPFVTLHPSDPYDRFDFSEICNALAPRANPPASVNDLRIDDIGVVMAMGDSFMAG